MKNKSSTVRWAILRPNSFERAVPAGTVVKSRAKFCISSIVDGGFTPSLPLVLMYCSCGYCSFKWVGTQDCSAYCGRLVLHWHSQSRCTNLFFKQPIELQSSGNFILFILSDVSLPSSPMEFELILYWTRTVCILRSADHPPSIFSLWPWSQHEFSNRDLAFLVTLYSWTVSLPAGPAFFSWPVSVRKISTCTLYPSLSFNCHFCRDGGGSRRLCNSHDCL